ncbi:hypothetical protein G6699_06460 [Polynucleobacter paneuropaeus]|nr:hypothetical protein [Polynucleobacter paneuropaeus]
MSLLQQFYKAQVDADADKKIKAVAGKATLYRRSSTKHWQVRFKLANGKWHSQSTCTEDKDEAITNAEYIYQTVQIKTEAGLTPITKTFKQIAVDELANMAQAMASGVGKRTYRDYIFAINKYLIPFFGNYTIEKITTELVRDFESWRIAMMGKVPMQSTKRNHASAYIRVINLAKEKGVISSTRVVPMLDSKGEKSRARPAFADKELEDLIAYTPSWVDKAYTERTRQMRILCSFYIQFLVNTGIRHGTEAFLWSTRYWLRE